MGWQDAPRPGERWRTVRKPVETRTVVDRTLGGHVVYVAGRFSRFAHRTACTEAEWQAWQKGARRIDA